MKAFFLTVCAAMSLSSWSQASINPYADLVSYTTKSGESVDMADGTTLFYLQNIVPADTTKTHQSDYFVVNAAVYNGKVLPFSTAEVTENWVLNSENNWEIDQWLYSLDLNGSLKDVQHIALVETQTGRVLRDDILPTGGVGDPAIASQWNTKLGEWYAKVPAQP